MCPPWSSEHGSKPVICISPLACKARSHGKQKRCSAPKYEIAGDEQWLNVKQREYITLGVHPFPSFNSVSILQQTQPTRGLLLPGWQAMVLVFAIQEPLGGIFWMLSDRQSQVPVPSINTQWRSIFTYCLFPWRGHSGTTTRSCCEFWRSAFFNLLSIFSPIFAASSVSNLGMGDGSFWSPVIMGNLEYKQPFCVCHFRRLLIKMAVERNWHEYMRSLLPTASAKIWGKMHHLHQVLLSKLMSWNFFKIKNVVKKKKNEGPKELLLQISHDLQEKWCNQGSSTTINEHNSLSRLFASWSFFSPTSALSPL